MKGGMSRGAGVPLRDRVRTGTRPDDAPTPEPVADQPCPARHVWVSLPVDATEPRPGLLLEWRKVEHRWEGRVVYLAELRPGRWSLVEEWIAAELLTPA
ncbi:MAG TPA: hypothetical protein VI452_06780 [Marmoricola sp.]